MEKVSKKLTENYLLGINNKFSVSTNRGLFILMGALFLVQGIFRLFFSDSHAVFDYGLGSVLAIGGIAYFFYAYYNFSETSEHAARVQFDEEKILVKKNFLKKGTRIQWEEVQALELGNYSLGFQVNGHWHYFDYWANPENSIKIKSAIRNKANEKGIEVN